MSGAWMLSGKGRTSGRLNYGLSLRNALATLPGGVQEHGRPGQTR